MLQIQDQSLRPLTTAHLAQTMSLLVLSNQELRDRVFNELAENPALELLDERVCPNCQRILTNPGPCPVCSRQKGDGEAIVFLSPRDSIRRRPRPSASGDQPFQDIAAPESLAAHVLQQLASELETEHDRRLAAYILGSLDDDGFLNDPQVYIAQATRSTLAQVSNICALIATADPVGLATSGPREALQVQLGHIAPKDERVVLARRILDEAFSELARREYDKIAKQIGASKRAVKQAATFIHVNLNPFPARANWGSGHSTPRADANVYQTPDIMISKNPLDPDGALIVEIFSPFSGWLRVNPLFRDALGKSEDAEQWGHQLESANLFVKCIQQRNNTMRRLMAVLVRRQRRFILDGPRYLTPMTRAEIAREIGVHESTISRAVAHKSVALPNGRIIPLAKFFDRSLSVRDLIKEIVAGEAKPLTDDEIAALLSREGIKIARRTVAKYRAIEGILPARLRGQGKLMQPLGA